MVQLLVNIWWWWLICCMFCLFLQLTAKEDSGRWISITVVEETDCWLLSSVNDLLMISVNGHPLEFWNVTKYVGNSSEVWKSMDRQYCLGYFSFSTNVRPRCYYRVVYNNLVFQQDSAPVHLALNTVKLMQCKTLNFLSPELLLHNSPTDYKN